MLPLNPFRVIQNHFNSIAVAYVLNVTPEPDVMARIFSDRFQSGVCIDPRLLLHSGPQVAVETAVMDWEEAAHSPGLKAISAQFAPEPVCTEPAPAVRMGHGSALQMIASSSLFATRASSCTRVPLDTTAVRRSTRSNKYDGFKVNQISDNRQPKSRVKARVVPTLRAVSMAAAPTSLAATACPAPTSVEEIQQVGARCGIPPEDLSAEKLLDDQSSAPDGGN